MKIIKIQKQKYVDHVRATSANLSELHTNCTVKGKQ